MSVLDWNKVKESFFILKDAMQDEDYAWSWHCNLAMMAYDAGADSIAANYSAANFMKVMFDCDTSKNVRFKALIKDKRS